MPFKRPHFNTMHLFLLPVWKKMFFPNMDALFTFLNPIWVPLFKFFENPVLISALRKIMDIMQFMELCASKSHNSYYKLCGTSLTKLKGFRIPMKLEIFPESKISLCLRPSFAR